MRKIFNYEFIEYCLEIKTIKNEILNGNTFLEVFVLTTGWKSKTWESEDEEDLKWKKPKWKYQECLKRLEDLKEDFYLLKMYDFCFSLVFVPTSLVQTVINKFNCFYKAAGKS